VAGTGHAVILERPLLVNNVISKLVARSIAGTPRPTSTA
jgi:hypothetical protein